MNGIKLLVEDLYGYTITEVKQLDGELDQNYKVETLNAHSFILKIANEEHDLSHLEMENAAMLHLAAQDHLPFKLPVPIHTLDGSYIATYNGKHVRLIKWIDGKLWAHVKPQVPALLLNLGQSLGHLHRGLQDFDHEKLHRDFGWDPSRFEWVANEVDAFFPNSKERLLIDQIIVLSNGQKGLRELPKSCCYLDANDYNILVSNTNETSPSVAGFIDFGDITYTHRINELAVCLAYACMGKNDPMEAAIPVIRGFHSIVPLLESEIHHLYGAILRRLSATVAYAAKRKAASSGNLYHSISEQSAWDLIRKLLVINPRFAEICFRSACGWEPAPNSPKVIQWIENNRHALHPVWGDNITSDPITVFDWSVGSTALGNVDEFHDIDMSTFKVFRQMKEEGADIGIGRYNEPRPVYSTLEYARKTNDGPEWRTVHLGIDIFLPAGTPLYAPLNGEVVISHNDAGDKEYGPLLVLKHTPQKDICFFTLYGHNDPELLSHLKVGDQVLKGDRIVLIGDYPENGNWVPHCHFQIMSELLGYTDDFPGVAYPSLREVWLSICPDANLMLGLTHDLLHYTTDQKEKILEKRRKVMGPNLSISYQDPLHITRGYLQYLFDETGRRYLDTVNNVPHVGHQHPRIVRAAQNQTAILNTNTRYLHHTIVDYAEALLKKLPAHLEVIYFVNSGSEANELALRLAQNYAGQKGCIALDHGYHGNSGSLVGLSAYKSKGPGGAGMPGHVGLMPVPDVLRDEEEADYARQIFDVISSLKEKGFIPGTCIHETILSCGGQLVMPKAFFDSIYQATKKENIITIADEVQTGFGRIGKHFWSFEIYDIAPDIVTMGKPIGNGHPLGAVATTRAVAEKFDNGMEFFATFGGNPVSCAIGLEVLNVIEDEQLQQNALDMGNYLKMKLSELMQQFPIIGDVRGYGLFLGVELVKDKSLTPAGAQVSYLLNRMKDKGVLMSSDGPHHNVLKIKPPMCFSKGDADFLVEKLSEVLAEDRMVISR